MFLKYRQYLGIKVHQKAFRAISFVARGPNRSVARSTRSISVYVACCSSLLQYVSETPVIGSSYFVFVVKINWEWYVFFLFFFKTHGPMFSLINRKLTPRPLKLCD